MPEISDLRVVLVGCGDLGTGVAHRLFVAGFPVVALELERPLAVRRLAAFAEAARTGRVVVEGVPCRLTSLGEVMLGGWERHFVPLVVEPVERALAALSPAIVVDARLAKGRERPVTRAAAFVVVLGPGYVAGRDCDAVIETWRGPTLGHVVWSGETRLDTGHPATLAGAAEERVLRAPIEGLLRVLRGIGARIECGDVVARVESDPGEAAEVRARVGGVLRGLLAEGDPVAAGQKLGDVEPRPDAPAPDRISDKARAVGDGVLRAILERFQIGPVGPGGTPPPSL